MSQNSLYEKLKSVLPRDLPFKHLWELMPEKLRQEDPNHACAYALAQSPLINWQAYLELYPDVKTSGITPVQHFIQYGMYEGRKLLIWHPLKCKDTANMPLISVVICNYNNAAFLKKCILSVLSQTLSNIEIIIVDDASEDNSCEIISAYAAVDERIKTVFHDRNKSSYMTRKIGVQTASGRYIMFLDSDDFLAQDACKIAYNEIIKGYDIVAFNISIVNFSNMNNNDIKNIEHNFNKGANKEYTHSELINALFFHNSLFCNLVGKLYLRELLQHAYNELEDGYFNMYEDRYVMIAVARLTRNFLKIDKQLYFYTYGVGISTNHDLIYSLNTWHSIGNVINACGAYAKKHGFNINFGEMKRHHARLIIDKWLHINDTDQDNGIFAALLDGFGFDAIISALLEASPVPSLRLVQKYKKARQNAYKNDAPLKKIGIFYHRISMGGIQRILTYIADALIRHGYEVTLFTEEIHDREYKFEKHVKIVNINMSGSGINSIRNHLYSFNKAIENDPVDLLIHAGAATPTLFWDIMLMDQHGIPIIINYHGNFALSFTDIYQGYKTAVREAIYSCADAVTVLSRETELYCRMQGINATYIHNPVHLPSLPTGLSDNQYSVAIIARFGDPVKQIKHLIPILAEVASILPSTKAIMIGDFDSSQQRDEFINLAEKAGITKNITITGWTDNSRAALGKCRVLLSTSWWEAFPMGIAEAQANGLPCVIYDLPIEQAKDNPSIIRVEQGNHKAAAKAIINLFTDKNLYDNLSGLARKNSAKYSPENFEARLLELLTNFSRYSDWGIYKREEYNNIIEYGAFYSNQNVPRKF